MTFRTMLNIENIRSIPEESSSRVPCMLEDKINLGDVWYMHLKTKNMYLKICVKIRVDEKICGNTYNVV